MPVITFEKLTVEEPNFITNGGIIYPGDFGIFWYSNVQYDGELLPPKRGVIEYELEYSSTDLPKKYQKSEKMRYSLNSFEPYSCDWDNIEDSVDKVI